MELLKFSVTITRFSFRGTLYQQKFGTVMGSPMSPVIANLVIEWLEQQAIFTLPITCKPKLWKRYMDNVMEVVRKGCEQGRTEHLNSVDTTAALSSHMKKRVITPCPSLDILMIRKEE